MALAFQIGEELKIVCQSSLHGSYCWFFYSFLLLLRLVLHSSRAICFGSAS